MVNIVGSDPTALSSTLRVPELRAVRLTEGQWPSKPSIGVRLPDSSYARLV